MDFLTQFTPFLTSKPFKSVHGVGFSVNPYASYLVKLQRVSQKLVIVRSKINILSLKSILMGYKTISPPYWYQKQSNMFKKSKKLVLVYTHLSQITAYFAKNVIWKFSHKRRYEPNFATMIFGILTPWGFQKCFWLLVCFKKNFLIQDRGEVRYLFVRKWAMFGSSWVPWKFRGSLKKL